MPWMPSDLLGKKVWTGCGELLGRVVAVKPPTGEPEHVVVRQPDGAKDWHVEVIHLKDVTDRAVHLKGPREGFHIAPLPALPATIPA